MCASIWILLYVLYHDRDIHSCLISKTRLRNIVPSLYLRLQTFHALLHTHVLYLYIYKSQHHSQLYRKRGITGMNTELIPIKYTPTLRCFSPHGIPKQWWIQGGARWRAPPPPPPPPPFRLPCSLHYERWMKRQAMDRSGAPHDCINYRPEMMDVSSE